MISVYTGSSPACGVSPGRPGLGHVCAHRPPDTMMLNDKCAYTTDSIYTSRCVSANTRGSGESAPPSPVHASCTNDGDGYRFLRTRHIRVSCTHYLSPQQSLPREALLPHLTEEETESREDQ